MAAMRGRGSMPNAQSGKPAVSRSSSAPAGPRHTSTVGALLYHETAKSLRNHKRDNVLAMREKARQLRARREEEAAQKRPDFKLKQFENVPSRLHCPQRRSSSTPSRPSSASSCPAGGDGSVSNTPVSKSGRRVSTGSPECQTPSAGWRVSAGYGSLTPPVSAPFTPPPRFTPPQRAARKSLQVRPCSTPVKSTRSRKTVQASPVKNLAAGDEEAEHWCDDEVGLDIANFERAAKQLNQMHGRRTLAKDAQGGPTQLQFNRSSSSGLLYHDDGSESAVPLGFRLAPEEERQDTLQRLQEKLVDLSDRYNRLPLRIETEGQRQQQQLLRTKIAETERAVQVFSRSRVFVEL